MKGLVNLLAYGIVFVLSGVVTLTDLASRFREEPFLPLASWFSYLFFLINGAVAVSAFFLYAQVKVDAALLDAVGVGLGFPALLKSRLTSIGGVDIGIDPLYRFWTNLIREHISFDLLPRRLALKEEILQNNLLPKLQAEVSLLISNLPLLSQQERVEQQAYVGRELAKLATDEEKKSFLVDYLYTNYRGNKRRYFRERGLLP